MTPDDVTAIRFYAVQRAAHVNWPVLVLSLCDELEKAWAERDQERRESDALDSIFEADVIALRERAERAELQRDVAVKQAESMAREVTKRGEALARVRALCEKFPDHPLIEMVRAAIDDQ